MIHASEAWDFSWMAAAVQSLETYEAALETAEFPSLILAALDELLQAPEANALQLQELTDVLLQMIAFPIDLELPPDTVTTLHSTRDWAIQTLLDIQVAQLRDLNGDDLQPPTMSKSLQQMQNKLFVSAPCRQADVQMELHQSLLAAVQSEEEKDTVSDVLEMCATSLENDKQFLQFSEAALTGKSEELVFGSAFPQRLFDRRSVQLEADEGRMRRGRRLFDALTLESKVPVWANHLPSWHSQLQAWMLEAHRAPFQPISAVLPDGWWLQDASSDSHSDSIAVVTACRRYSHLYVTFIEWCRGHVDLLSSCRSMELVSVISRSTRQDNAARLFNRQSLSQVPLGGLWTQNQRERAFVTLGSTLEHLQTTRSASDVVWQYEWIGVLERPHLLHEALEIAFSVEAGSGNSRLKGDEDLSAARCAAQFYSFSNSESTDAIAALLTTLSSELKVSDIRSGAQWLRRSRADFGTLPILRLRFVWFWLLKCIDVDLQTPAAVRGNHAASATTDVLESVEYIFRRFTPPRAKRPFQVELVAQLLVELEWRATNHNMKTRDTGRFLDGIAPLCAWLTKIVRLMQLEEQTAQQKDSRHRYSSRSSPANDVEHLTERLEKFSR
ncbi:hypothetical protein PC110_g19016 [Phytophthora cactorum]|uniref:Uncharacterized protein n=1 Tax=Phytophthora cactorum TaxID=29920 RepID=A0A329RIH5_9STRA|nr:hypothetical protein PC112_g6320 [Phytophthora cactorum]KAG2949588.1 hypothetical protein PC117_g5103 [Phytophthora cactorum]RAW24553.1 hypothetical protein PC110_g19016 [Phytophthora cactorum]